jgi:hypothetical protein
MLDMQQDRRRFLEAATAVGMLSVAGCSQNGSSDEGTDVTSDNTAQDGDTTASGGTSDGSTTESESMATTTPVGSGSVTLDLNLRVSYLSGFDKLVIKFNAFELRADDGENVRREGSGETVDLTTINKADLLTMKVPPGEYNDTALFMPVQDYELSNGENGQSGPFRNSDPGIIEIDSQGPYKLEANASKTFTATLQVVDSQNEGWLFSFGYSG